MQLYYLVFGLFFMFSSSVSAVELETIKVTSSRGTLTAEDIPASLSVFTEKEIKKKKFFTRDFAHRFNKFFFAVSFTMDGFFYLCEIKLKLRGGV